MRSGNPASRIIIDLAKQKLSLYRAGMLQRQFPVSTARNGAGEQAGSECTPRGWHVIRARIGEGEPLGTVFVGRRPTGEIYSAELAASNPGRDWILTRILWLGGQEAGKNRYHSVDTAWRYIYLHGCPDQLIDGTPGSHGCVRLKNADMLALFSLVDTGTPVWIG